MFDVVVLDRTRGWYSRPQTALITCQVDGEYPSVILEEKALKYAVEYEMNYYSSTVVYRLKMPSRVESMMSLFLRWYSISFCAVSA